VKTHRGLAAPLPTAWALVLAGALVPSGAGADWVAYTDETATRLVTGDPEVGANDLQEKDYISGDVDKDGDSDLVVVRKVPFTNDCPPCSPIESHMRDVLFMNEDGVLTDRTASLAPDLLPQDTNDRDVELVDVDGDGWLDIVIASTFEDQPRVLMNRRESGGEWRGFQLEPARLPFLESPQGVGPFFCGLGVGDLTGDGRPDLYFADYGGIFFEGQDLNDRLLINNPANPGFFSDQTEARTEPDMVESCFGTDADMGDMNGDGFLDVIRTTGVGSSPPGVGCPRVNIFYNDGTGHLVFNDAVYSDAPYMAEPGDFTQDDRLDLFVVDDGQDRYLINTGNDGQGHADFGPPQDPLTSPDTIGFGGNVKFADLDRDHRLDVIVADVDTDIDDCGQGEFTLLRAEGTPPNLSYRDPFGGITPWTNYSAFDVEAMHINDDGLLDLVIGACNGTRIFINANWLFADGFESGDTSAWDETGQ
jgi:hypothetical protein